MSYLVCDKCGSYYELQPGESPEDFTDQCECGGKLFYEDDSSPHDNKIVDQTTGQRSWKQPLFINLEPKFELKLWGLIMIVLGAVELFFGLEIIFTINGHFPMAVMSLLLGIYFIPLGILPLIIYNKKIYWLYSTVMVLALIQFIILTTNSTVLNTANSILIKAGLLLIIGILVRKATGR